MTDARRTRDGGPLRPAVVVSFSLVGYAALAIAGTGVTSLLLDAEVIRVPGGAQAPGIVGMLLSIAAFGGALAFALRTRHPSFASAPFVAIAAALFYAFGVFAGATATGTGPAAAVAAAGTWLVGPFALVVALAALFSAWAGIALVRTRARRPRWPWEGEDPEE